MPIARNNPGLIKPMIDIKGVANICGFDSAHQNRHAPCSATQRINGSGSGQIDTGSASQLIQDALQACSASLAHNLFGDGVNFMVSNRFD